MQLQRVGTVRHCHRCLSPRNAEADGRTTRHSPPERVTCKWQLEFPLRGNVSPVQLRIPPSAHLNVQLRTHHYCSPGPLQGMEREGNRVTCRAWHLHSECPDRKSTPSIGFPDVLMARSSCVRAAALRLVYCINGHHETSNLRLEPEAIRCSEESRPRDTHTRKGLWSAVGGYKTLAGLSGHEIQRHGQFERKKKRCAPDRGGSDEQCTALTPTRTVDGGHVWPSPIEIPFVRALKATVSHHPAAFDPRAHNVAPSSQSSHSPLFLFAFIA